MNILNIIGIGLSFKDLTHRHLSIIQNCDVLIGGPRLLKQFEDLKVETIAIDKNIKTLISRIQELMPTKKVVVLASGDPLLHGIGTTLTKHIPSEYIAIHPNISSIAAAFAAIRIPWHDAKIISLHGKNRDFAFNSLRNETKAAFLTDQVMTPGVIAKKLIQAAIYDFKLCVLEFLGDDLKEKISWFNSLENVAEMEFGQPNIVILIRNSAAINPDAPRETSYIGMDDSLFRHQDGLITKSEIRAVTLSKLKLARKDHVLWDIGAGSGSVGIEASFHIPLGSVFAFEKHPHRIADIIHNVSNFNCPNIKIINANFPESAEGLSTPDRIFIGGGGKDLDVVLKEACKRLSPFGVIVVNTVLIQNMSRTLQILSEYNFRTNAIQLQVSRSRTMPFGDRMEALNPVWIIQGTKPENNGNTNE